MKTTKLLLLAFVIGLMLLNSCSLNVARKGYKKAEIYYPCRVYIFRNLNDTNELKRVGSIELSEIGLTVNCDWFDSMILLRKEACAAGANVVNITREYKPGGLHDCYRFDADFYLDTNNSVIEKYYTYDLPYHEKIDLLESAPFKNLPFNYVNLSFDTDYTSMNEHFWEDVLSDYHVPKHQNVYIMPMLGVSLVYRKYYFDFKAGFNGYEDQIEDTLKASISAQQIEIELGYNIINKGITLSQFIGFRYFYQNHTVSQNKDKITIDQYIYRPDLSIRANQLSAIVGLNIIYPYYQIFTVSASIGYILNLHKYPYLNSNQSSISNNISLVKNFSFNFGLGIGIPTENISYPNYSIHDD
jgi:hypothetical protein